MHRFGTTVPIRCIIFWNFAQCCTDSIQNHKLSEDSMDWWQCVWLWKYFLL